MVNEHDTGPPAPRLAEAVVVWAQIGCLSFGGPAGQIALMHRMLVEERRWISEARFLHALNYCMLLPGPEAQQLATYVGWLLHGTRGGIVAGLLFIVPGFLVMLGLSAAYAQFNGTEWLQALFFGLKAAVLAIVIEAVIRVGRRALKGRLHHGIAALSFVALFVFDIAFPIVIVAAGLLGFAVARQSRPAAGGTAPTAELAADRRARAAAPTGRRTLQTLLVWIAVWQAPLLAFALLADGANVFAALFSFFSRMALVTFGGAYAVLSYVAQMAVGQFGWLAPGEMLDGLALAETTPGPLVLVLCFVGFLASARHSIGLDPLLAGLIGATLTAWATFVPSFIWIFAGAPYVERLRHHAALSAALSAITAAVVGVILNLAIWFGLHVLFGTVGRLVLWPPSGGTTAPVAAIAWPDWHTLDGPALAILAFACLLVFRTRIGIPATLAACGGVGLVWRNLL